jgi:hypothetical protein
MPRGVIDPHCWPFHVFRKDQLDVFAQVIYINLAENQPPFKVGLPDQ